MYLLRNYHIFIFGVHTKTSEIIIQVVKKAITGDTFGEIGVLYNRPQPLTVRTTELSQILRLSRTSLMNAMHANPEVAPLIMTNLFMVIKIFLDFINLISHIYIVPLPKTLILVLLIYF